MAVIVPIVGAKSILQGYLAAGARKLRLYKNNYTPVAATIETDLTEADFSGYAEANLAAGDWSPPIDDGAGRALSSNTIKTFANTTGAVGNNIYGYYVYQAGFGLLWAERFAGAPVDVLTAGKVVYVVPVLTMRSEF